MRNLLFVFICILGFSGCQNVSQPEKPKNLISKSKMVDILTQSYMANAARSVNNQTIIEKGIILDSLIYRNFGVDSLQFANSNAYYAADVNSYMEIFKQVELKLTTMQQQMDSLRVRDLKLKDSLGENQSEVKEIPEPIKDSLI